MSEFQIDDHEASPVRPTSRELFATFGRIGLVNFGGPAGQIALMHRVLVDEKRWIDEDAYLRALNFCTLLPGPEAQQLATYVGWRLRGLPGGLTAGLLFIAPGALVVLALSLLYAYAADLVLVQAAFLGVKAAVLALVVEALLRVGRRALNAPVKVWIAILAFLALALFQAPFPLVVVLAAAVGALVAWRRPEALSLRVEAPSAAPAGGLVVPAVRTAVTWAAIWAAPMALIAATLGPDHVLFEIGAFFSKLAMVTFGGAYAVLAYMAQEAVNVHGWLDAREMIDGLGLAETTPGPLILVTEFVGFLGAFRAPAPFTPLVAGILGAAVTLWVTFAPCFLWIFTFAPAVERLQHAQRLQGALAAITAAVVGVIANLTLWFGLHVLFARFEPATLAGRMVEVPRLASFSPLSAALALVAGLLLLRLHWSVMRVLGVSVALSLAARVILAG